MERSWRCRNQFFKYFTETRSTITKFFGDLFTDVFNSIYNQQIDQKSARNVIIGFFIVVGVTTIIFAGLNTYKNFESSDKKIEAKKPEPKLKKKKKT